MSNVNDYLDQMDEKEDYEKSSIGIVREIKIETGWHGYEKGCGHDFWKYWRPFDLKSEKSGEEMKTAYLSSKDMLESDGLEKNPAKSFKITTYPDSADKNEMRDLYAVWMEDVFALISKSVRDNNLPLNEKFWGRVSFVPDPNAVAKGEEGKTEEYEGRKTYPNIRVPVQKFANEQEALDFVAANSNNASTSSAISEAAQSNAESIITDWEKARTGVLPYPGIPDYERNFPALPEKITPSQRVDYENQIVKWLANDVWQVAISDIEQLIEQLVAGEISF